MSVISIFLLTDMKDIMSEEFREKGILLATEFSQKAAEGIVIEDKVILDKFISQLCQSKDVMYVHLYNETGLKLAQRVLHDGIDATSPPNAKVEKLEISELPAGERNIHATLDIITPVRYENRIVGAIQLGISLKRIDEEVNKRILNSSILVISFIFIGLVICFFFSRTFSKPISQLLESVKKIKQGNLFHQVNVYDKGEVGELAAAFNQMIERLSESEDKLKKYAAELEIKVEERTSELKETNEQLARDILERKKSEKERMELQEQLESARKMELIGTLAGGVAHDLNNILSGLVTYPELLLMELPENSSLRKSILIIQKSGRKAAAIVQDLLALARRGVTVTETINLNGIISDFMASPEFEKIKQYHPDVQFEMNNFQSLMNIEGSPVHLSKCIMNLISNAAEAMPDGGKVVISTSNKYLDKPVKGHDDIKTGEYVVLSISDSGVGMAAEELGRIFEPFYTKKKMDRSGTGLGMAVVWGTVNDHNGYIDVQSIEGKGTRFDLYFPSTIKKPNRREANIPLDELKGNEKILVVDDLQEQREIASLILEKLGYSVKTFPSGEEVVEYMKSNSADLLVLDMIMNPGIDGLETYREILKYCPDQKAIIASGFSESERVKEAQSIGVGSYIKKPYSVEKIGLAVRTELDS